MPGIKNLLSLHEAIVIALINVDKERFSASFEEIANYIDRKNLFPIREGGITLAKQIELRSTQSKGAYTYLFEKIGKERIALKLKPKTQRTT